MLIPNRNGNSPAYRYGFNGKENDNEVMGEGNFEDYGMRMYNTRLGRFFNVDPLTKQYPELTPYQFASNTPIQAIDLDGLERLDVVSYNPETRTVVLKIVKHIYIDNQISDAMYKKIDHTKVSEIFNKGNCTLYTTTLPQNGQELNFASLSDYNSGTAYKLEITYDVQSSYQDDIWKVIASKPENSVVKSGVGQSFTSDAVPAKADINGTNYIYTNPNYKEPEDAIKSQLMTPEEIIAHEAGIHNMAGIQHQKKDGVAFYPKGITLETNVHGNILPSENDTQLILNNSLKKRKSLNDVNKELEKK